VQNHLTENGCSVLWKQFHP